MARPFDAFVVLAEMRTGSNHLEAMLDRVPGITMHGEVFNPVFIGRHDGTELFGFDLAAREADPQAFLDEIVQQSPGLPGFRYFHDHDPRILPRLLSDRRIGKVILTRNPLDSYISRRIAAETGQWKLTDARHRRDAEVRFDPAEFEAMLADWQGFRARVRRGLQETGQTAFELDYTDLNAAEVLNGLLRFLRVDGAIDPAASRLKPQNPGGPMGKVSNPDEMQAAIARLDPFGLDRPLAEEAGRSPTVKSFVTADAAGLLYMPVPGALVRETLSWLAAVERVPEDALPRGLTQRELRGWMRDRPGHRRFTLVRHPVARAHHVFCRDVLPRGRPVFAVTRKVLRNRYGVPLPGRWPDPDYDIAAHRAAFLAFLEFLKPCLAAQTSIDPPATWAGQNAVIQGMAGFALPDVVVRDRDLAAAPSMLGHADAPPWPVAVDNAPFPLSAIHDADLEAAARAAYRRDYLVFGFGDWR
ncbi:nodulation protein NodH [Rhodobacterales bacterium HKCCE2091]|nr:nodulation protein NodH [Rhodobacterales bacterium HKCCE2091]